MTHILLFIGIVMIACIMMQRITAKLSIPSLLVFLVLGMMFGVDGLFKISFDNYQMSDVICSACLIFIMFYGGFGTSFKAAKPVLIRSASLASVGVLLTAAFTGAFVHFVLKLDWLQSLLIGSVIASTDAASVFGILRSRNLNLKDNTASLLEVESGSNDPVSYMLTVVLCTLMSGQEISVFVLLFKQIVFGFLLGLVFGKTASKLMKSGHIHSEGSTIFVLAIVLLTYAASALMGGNGYLSVYICGILMGNTRIKNKRQLVQFFDTLTSMAQMMIFFLLGLLVTPSELPEVFVPALIIMVFLTLIGRPLAVLMTLIPFGTTVQQVGLVSWSGLRGVASIVFAITIVLSDSVLSYNIFNLVFCIVLLSISIQGTLLPKVAQKLNMIDDTNDVLKTFTDYEEESNIRFIKIHVDGHHSWISKPISELPIPKEFLIVLILRNGKELVPNGSTIVEQGDLMVIAAQEFSDRQNLSMQEIIIDKNHSWVNLSLKQITLDEGSLVIMIKRNETTVIPGGETVILPEDTLVIAKH
ncbi:MAG: potassium/proton antiporter [Erysipelotrichaceae bacterium]|nr:potassium/proton antiporter [Erysipelotrichaceae bacterium]